MFSNSNNPISQEFTSILVACPNGKTLSVTIPSQNVTIDEIQRIIWNKYQFMQWLERVNSIISPLNGCIHRKIFLNLQFLLSQTESLLSYLSSLFLLLRFNHLYYSPHCHQQQCMILSYNGKVMRRECLLYDYVSWMTTTSMITRPSRTKKDLLEEEENVMTTTSPPMIILHLSFPLQGGCFLISFSIILMICGAILMSFCTCGTSLIFIPLLLPLLFILPFFCL